MKMKNRYNIDYFTMYKTYSSYCRAVKLNMGIIIALIGLCIYVFSFYLSTLMNDKLVALTPLFISINVIVETIVVLGIIYLAKKMKIYKDLRDISLSELEAADLLLQNILFQKGFIHEYEEGDVDKFSRYVAPILGIVDIRLCNKFTVMATQACLRYGGTLSDFNIPKEVIIKINKRATDTTNMLDFIIFKMCLPSIVFCKYPHFNDLYNDVETLMNTEIKRNERFKLLTTRYLNDVKLAIEVIDHKIDHDDSDSIRCQLLYILFEYCKKVANYDQYDKIVEEAKINEL